MILKCLIVNREIARNTERLMSTCFEWYFSFAICSLPWTSNCTSSTVPPTLTKTFHSTAVIFLLIYKLTVLLREVRLKNSKSFFLLLGKDIVLLFSPVLSLSIKFTVFWSFVFFRSKTSPCHSDIQCLISLLRLNHLFAEDFTETLILLLSLALDRCFHLFRFHSRYSSFRCHTFVVSMGRLHQGWR